MNGFGYFEKKYGKNANKKEATEAIDMPRIPTTRTPYTGYYITIRRARHFYWQINWETSTTKLHKIKLIIEW